MNIEVFVEESRIRSMCMIYFRGVDVCVFFRVLESWFLRGIDF